MTKALTTFSGTSSENLEPFPDKIGEVCLRKEGSGWFIIAHPPPAGYNGPLLYLGKREFLAIETNAKFEVRFDWTYWEEFAKPFYVRPK